MSATLNETGLKTFRAGAAIAQFARVKLQANGTVITAGLAEKDIGTATVAAFAANDPIAVRLRTSPGTHLVIAKEAFAAGAALYTEAGGKVQDTAETTAFLWGTALQAATAENDVVEALVNTHGDTAAS